MQGAGQALRVLAVMEPDIARSWEVVGLTLDTAIQQESSGPRLFWKDPLVLG